MPENSPHSLDEISLAGVASGARKLARGSVQNKMVKAAGSAITSVGNKVDKKVFGPKKNELTYDYDETNESDDLTEEELDVLANLLLGESEEIVEAEYQGRKVPLGKPMRGDVKKFKVYVKDPKTGNVKKVNFGDPNMKIKKSNPKRRKSFRARHNCDNPGPRTKARYWSCRKW